MMRNRQRRLGTESENSSKIIAAHAGQVKRREKERKKEICPLKRISNPVSHQYLSAYFISLRTTDIRYGHVLSLLDGVLNTLGLLLLLLFPSASLCLTFNSIDLYLSRDITCTYLLLSSTMSLFFFKAKDFLSTKITSNWMTQFDGQVKRCDVSFPFNYLIHLS